jgi:trehalose 6-phosphate synthase/phosphatase
VEREFETRVDQERNRIFYNKHVTTVDNLPLGIDVDVIKEQVSTGLNNSFLTKLIREMIGIPETETQHPLDEYFANHRVILGVDRLDYTKGLTYRLSAVDRFFEKNPQYIEKAVYLGIIAPSREAIPSYKVVKKEVKELEKKINEKYATNNWKPIHLIHEVFPRNEVLNFYKKADVCLVTPLDDGMNLVSKEFIIASSVSDNPGMLVLSQFAGSAIDLTDALIVNPYSIDEVADAIKKGLTMEKKERVSKTKHMAEILEERNVYEWAEQFFKRSLLSLR